jgi:hypothetical protein
MSKAELAAGRQFVEKAVLGLEAASELNSRKVPKPKAKRSKNRASR